MKKYFSQKFKNAKLHVENFRQKMIVRVWNLAKRLDQSHSKDEKRKPKKGK